MMALVDRLSLFEKSEDSTPSSPLFSRLGFHEAQYEALFSFILKSPFHFKN